MNIIQAIVQRNPTDPDIRLALIEDFLIFGQQRGYTAHTLNSYREAITDFFDFFRNADLRTIKPREIGQWMPLADARRKEAQHHKCQALRNPRVL